jgi:hypothetical protein
MTKYFIHDGTNELGPFLMQDLQQQKLSAQTPVWFDGRTEWTRADQIPELAHLINTPPLFVNSTPPPIIKTVAVEEKAVYDEPVSDKKRLAFPLSAVALAACICIIWFLSAKGNMPDTTPGPASSDSVAEKRPPDDERQRRNEELTRKNMNYRNNWTQYITVTNGDYRASALGGILGLEVVIVNDTDYLLDEVDADVTYIKSNHDTWKTISIPVTNIPAHSKKTVPVEDVDRGTSVKISASSIMSKKMHFYYSSEYNSGNNEDPYFYK